MIEKNKILEKIRLNLRTYTMIIALLLIWLFFGFFTDWIFFKPRNLSNLFRQMSIIGFLATGMVMVIVTGGIDLSVGSVTGFVSAIVAYLQAYLLPGLLIHILPNASIMERGIVSTVIAVISGLLVGLIVGIWQGSIIAYLKVPAFIVTLGGMLIFRGGVLGVTAGKTIVPIEDSFRMIAQGYISKSLGYILAVTIILFIFSFSLRGRQTKKAYGFSLRPLWMDIGQSTIFSMIVIGYVFIMNSYRGVQIPVLILAIVALIMTYVANNTRFGRYVYALGGNLEATRLSGINIKKTTFKVYALMGLLSGAAGIVLTGYVAAGTTGGGTNYELDTIASCVIGGTSLMGGSGSIIGALVGATVMASLVNGMSVMNMDIFWQYIVKGMVLIFAVYIDVTSKKKTV